MLRCLISTAWAVCAIFYFFTHEPLIGCAFMTLSLLNSILYELEKA